MESSVLDGDLRIGDFVVRPLLKVIRPAAGGAADECKLPDKAMAVLVYLAQNARQVCDREDLLDAVWGPDREAYDRVLDNAIAEIRRAFGDDARAPRYIQTIPKRGYRLKVDVDSRLLRVVVEEPLLETAPPSDPRTEDPFPAPAPQPLGEPTRRRRHRISLALAGFLVVALGALAVWSRPADVVRVEIENEGVEPDLTIPGEIMGAVEHALFEHHPCESDSLLSTSGSLQRSDLQVRLSRTASEERRLSAEILLRGSPRRLLLSAGTSGDGATDLAASWFVSAIAADIDHQICRLNGLPPAAQACHCLASTRTYQHLGDPEPHLEHLRRAIELDPELIPAYEKLATLLQSLGRSAEVRDVLNSGLSRVNDLSSHRALILRRRLAATFHDFATEGELIEQLQRRYPDEPRWTLAQAAHIAQHQRNCELALHLVDSVMEEHPQLRALPLEVSPEIWTCRLHTTDRSDLLKLHGQAPRDVASRFQLAIGSMLIGDLTRAKELANEILALEPGAADSYWLLGTIAWRSGKYSTANRWFEQMKPHIRWPAEETRFRVGSALVALHDAKPEPCLQELYEESIDGSEWSMIAGWAQGLCWLDAAQPDRAKETLDRLRGIQEVRATRWQDWLLLHLDGRIEIAAAEGDRDSTQRGVDLLLRAADTRPADFGFFATEAGWVLAAAGDSEPAAELLLRALEFNATNPWTHCHLGRLYRRDGDRALAIAHFRKSLEVFGNPPEDPLGLQCAHALAELDPEFEVAR